MQSRSLLVLAALVLASGLLPQPVHAQIALKGVASQQVVRRSGKYYQASSTYPQFRARTPLTRYINAQLRSEALANVTKFVKSTSEEAGWGPTKELNWEYQDQVKLYHYAPGRLVSLGQENYVFSGGAHGNYGTTGRNFALLPGAARPRELKLADFFRPGAAFRPRVEKLLLAKLRAKEASSVLDGSVKKLDSAMLNNFVAERGGLRWFFVPYAVASFAEGQYEVKLTTSELGPDFKRALIGG